MEISDHLDKAGAVFSPPQWPNPVPLTGANAFSTRLSASRTEDAQGQRPSWTPSAQTCIGRAVDKTRTPDPHDCIDH